MIYEIFTFFLLFDDRKCGARQSLFENAKNSDDYLNLAPILWRYGRNIVNI